MTVYNTIRPALLGIKDDGSVDILADDQGEPIAPTWAKGASGNVTGLVGPDGKPAYDYQNSRSRIIKASNSWMDDQPVGITSPVRSAGKLVCSFRAAEWGGYGGNAGGTGLSDTTGFDAYGNKTGTYTNGYGTNPVSITGHPTLLKCVPTDAANEGIGSPTTFATTIKTAQISGKIGLWLYVEGPSSSAVRMNLSTLAGDNSNGIEISWTSAVVKPGWNFLVAVLRNPAAYTLGNSAYEYHPDGVAISTTGTGANFNIIDNPIAAIRIYLASPDTGSAYYFDSLWTDFDTQAQYTLGFDASDNSIYNLALPLMRHRGYVSTNFYYIDSASKRIVTDYTLSTADNLHRFYDAGWEVVNHSATHIPGTLGTPTMATLTNAAEIAYELRALRAMFMAEGFVRGSHFYVSPNSATSELAEKVIADIGYPLQRHGQANAFLQITPYGLPNPRKGGGIYIGSSTAVGRKTTGGVSAQVTGFHQIQQAKEGYIDTAIAYGATLQLFTHGVESTGDDGTGNQVPTNANNIKYSHLQKLLEYLNEKEDAGEIRGLEGSDHLWYGD